MTRKLAFHCVNASLSLRFAIARMYRAARRTFASHISGIGCLLRLARALRLHQLRPLDERVRHRVAGHAVHAPRTFLSRARSFRAASRHLWKARYSAWCEIEARNRLESPTFASHTALALIWRCQAKNVDDIASREILATARLTNARWRRRSMVIDHHELNAAYCILCESLATQFLSIWRWVFMRDRSVSHRVNARLSVRRDMRCTYRSHLRIFSRQRRASSSSAPRRSELTPYQATNELANRFRASFASARRTMKRSRRRFSRRVHPRVERRKHLALHHPRRHHPHRGSVSVNDAEVGFHCVNASLSLRFAIARMYRSARRTFASTFGYRLPPSPRARASPPPAPPTR